MSMQTSGLNRPTYSDEIDFSVVFRALWAGKWWIGSIASTAAVIAIAVTLMMPNIYRAEALLAPSQAGGAGGTSSLTAQFGGLASLAGINLGGGSPDKIVLGLEILKSRKFVAEFIQRHDVLVTLMAAKDWDPGTGQLLINSKFYDVAAEKWVRKVNPPKKAIPSMQEAYESFKKLLFVNQDLAAGTVTISIEHYSPEVAKQWVEWLVEDLNATIMQQDVAQAEQAIAYLNQKIAATSLTDLQNVFFSLIEEQTKTVMLASVTDEYLLKTLDPPVVPERKNRPNRALIVIFCTILGVFLGSLYVLIVSKPK